MSSFDTIRQRIRKECEACKRRRAKVKQAVIGVGKKGRDLLRRMRRAT